MGQCVGGCPDRHRTSRGGGKSTQFPVQQRRRRQGPQGLEGRPDRQGRGQRLEGGRGQDGAVQEGLRLGPDGGKSERPVQPVRGGRHQLQGRRGRRRLQGG